MTLAKTVKERPILMSAPMVLALLAGRKTQTRRIVKPEPDGSLDYTPRKVAELYPVGCGGKDGRSWFLARDAQRQPVCAFRSGKHSITSEVACPYGQPGDRLWVKETHLLDPPNDGTWDYCGYTDGVLENLDALPDRFRRPEYVMYRADAKNPGEFRWRPSIFMPRWASRIARDLAGVRVERLQDITPEDAIAEGLSKLTKDGGQIWKYGIPDRDGLPGNDDHGWHWHEWRTRPVDAYRHLWEKINGPGSWDANPFVWVLNFRVEVAR